jgi:hypothetical protein
MLLSDQHGPPRQQKGLSITEKPVSIKVLFINVSVSVGQGACQNEKIFNIPILFGYSCGGHFVFERHE